VDEKDNQTEFDGDHCTTDYFYIAHHCWIFGLNIFEHIQSSDICYMVFYGYWHYDFTHRSIYIHNTQKKDGVT